MSNNFSHTYQLPVSFDPIKIHARCQSIPFQIEPIIFSAKGRHQSAIDIEKMQVQFIEINTTCFNRRTFNKRIRISNDIYI